MVPALALLGPWVALALVAAFRDGGSSDTGLTIAAVGAILASALALLLAAIGRLELPRPTGAGLAALAGLGLWCAVALASIYATGMSRPPYQVANGGCSQFNLRNKLMYF